MALLVLLGGASSVSATSYSIKGFGDLQCWDSVASDISADGSVVVGEIWSSPHEEQAVRWTEAEGIVGLGYPFPGGSRSSASGTSADGSVVVGHTRSGGMPSYSEAFRWTEAEGMVGLGDLGGSPGSSFAEDVSSDGSVVVGYSDSSSGWEAFRWTEAGGMVGLGDLPGGGFNSHAYGTSADGTIVVGRSHSSSGWQAFRWTAEGGMVGLGYLPGGSFSAAYETSADGSVVVGWSRSSSGREAFRWTEEGGMVGLGDLPGASFDSIAYDVSSDGSVVVGQSQYSSPYAEAFVWDEANGMRSIRQILIDQGIDMTAWHLTAATGISDDGLTIVGRGEHFIHFLPECFSYGYRQAWIATIETNPPVAVPSINAVGPFLLAMALLGIGLAGMSLRRKATKTS